jgi:hypothetical protein
MMNTLRQKKTTRPLEALEPLPIEKEDAYVVDDRAARRPSEEVQNKLLHLMPRRSVPVSCLHTQRMTRYQSPG